MFQSAKAVTSRHDVLLVAYRAGTEVIAKGALLIVTLVAARRLSIEEFGIFALGSTMGWVAAVATDLGMQVHLAREVARAPERAGGLLERWLRVRVGTSVAALAAIAAGIALAEVSAPHGTALLLVAAAYLLTGLVEFLHYFYRGLSRSDIESTLTASQRLLTLGLAGAVLWQRPAVTNLAAAMLAAAAAAFIYSLRRATTMARASRASASMREWTAERGTTFAHDVLPIGAGILLSALYFRVDIFLIQAWMGIEAVALYNAVFRLVEALRLFPAAVMAVAFPMLCRAVDAGPVVRTASLLSSAAGAVATALWLGAGWIVPLLYGTVYAEAVPLFRVLLLAFPLMSLNYALTHQIIGWDRQARYTAVCGLALGFNVALNAAMIPSLGVLGAAWSTVWTELLVTSGCLVALGVRSKHAPNLASGSSRLSDVPNLSDSVIPPVA